MASKGRKQPLRTNNAVMLHMDELGSRVVAQSGIPTDRFHIGKLIMQSLKDDPEFVSQIDGSINVSETNSSVLARSIRCACALKNLGLKVGDVMALMGPNHLDMSITVYAALYLGVIVAGTDSSLSDVELKDAFATNRPKVVFCQSDKTSDVEKAFSLSDTDAHIITFDKGSKFLCFTDFLLNNVSEREVKDFTPANFDTETTVAILSSTSGSTGSPKFVMLTHKNVAIGFPQYNSRFYDFPKPTRLDLLVSPIPWISSSSKYILSPILRFTRLQSSAVMTKDHIYELINTYKPSGVLISTYLFVHLLTPGDRDRCDFSCLEVALVGGSLVTPPIMDIIKSAVPNLDIEVGYGMSEVSGKALSWDNDCPSGSLGRPIGHLRYRIVDVSTLEDVIDPNVTGELWLKGPTICKGYYNNPKATQDGFTEDGWFKSGDLVYRDKNHNYFFVDRVKAVIKYNMLDICPTELEAVIRTHPSVLDVAVVGVPYYVTREIPAAAVVVRDGHSVTAEEIKDLVKDSLEDQKQLRGGVVFMKALPMTISFKIDRTKLKKMMADMDRE